MGDDILCCQNIENMQGENKKYDDGSYSIPSIIDDQDIDDYGSILANYAMKKDINRMDGSQSKDSDKQPTLLNAKEKAVDQQKIMQSFKRHRQRRPFVVRDDGWRGFFLSPSNTSPWKSISKVERSKIDIISREDEEYISYSIRLISKHSQNSNNSNSNSDMQLLREGIENPAFLSYVGKEGEGEEVEITFTPVSNGFPTTEDVRSISPVSFFDGMKERGQGNNI